MTAPEVDLQKLLLQGKVLTAQKLQELLVFANNQRLSLPEVLIEKEILSDRQIGQLIAKSLQIPFVDLHTHTIPYVILQIVPERIARKYKIIPFALEGTILKVATASPEHKDLVAMLEKKTGKKVNVFFTTESIIQKSLQLYQKDLQQILERLLKAGITSNELVSDAPIAKIVDVLITYAFRENASDIHIEPEEKNLLIRFRIDSVLRDVLSLDPSLHGRIVSRIKVLSHLRTDEHLSSQDGKMRLTIDEQPLDVRVSIIPITEGEKVVLRLLSTHFQMQSLTELGMEKGDIKKVNKAIEKTYGMILSTGPTGSGKTTSIYALLKSLNTREKNITTIEDPVEYRIKGINQIQVNTKTNLTFAQGLRSILRQDPNVIFVGEIRDAETAGIAINAALTGHLVLSTLHTNDAATALPRLIDMKIEPFLVASTVNLIIAQRLVRKICTKCKSEKIYTRQSLYTSLSSRVVSKYFGARSKIKLFSGKGCAVCHDTGYDGRIGIFEVMEISEAMKKLILQRQDSDVLQKQAHVEHMTTMFDDGLIKVTKGITTLEEVLRVIKTENL